MIIDRERKRRLSRTGSIAWVPFSLALKAEALHHADRTSDALGAITEAEALVESTGGRYMSAELHRLRGVFLAAMGAEETQIGFISKVLS